MDKNNLSISDMCEKLDVSNTILKNLISGKTEPDKTLRNKIRLIFEGEDAFPNIDDSYDTCKKCAHKCKQLYWISGLFCKKYSEK